MVRRILLSGCAFLLAWMSVVPLSWADGGLYEPCLAGNACNGTCLCDQNNILICEPAPGQTDCQVAGACVVTNGACDPAVSICCDANATCTPGPASFCTLGGGAGGGGNGVIVDIGTQFNLLQLFTRIAGFLASTIAIICVTLFIIGAFLWSASRGKDTMVQKGKDFMMGSVWGLIVVLSSYAILRTVYYLLYVQ